MSRLLSQSALIAPPVSSRSTIEQALVDAINHHNAGRSAEAERLYREILASPPGHHLASCGLGLLCAAQGRSREAIDAYRHAIALKPDFADAYINLGTTVLALGQPEEAAVLYKQAIGLSPGNALAYGNLGKTWQDLGRIGEAIDAYRTAIALEPDNPTILANFGAALLEQHAWDEAETVTRRAISLRPDNATAHANLGTALMNLGRREEALTVCRQAAALRPQGVAIHASLGGAVLELGAPEEAIDLCRQAIALDPGLPDAHYNLSHALKAMNRLDEAADAARAAIALCPNSAEYHFHLAHILLLQGDFEPGWVEYDWRWQLPDFAWISAVHGAFSQPRWTGQDIRDKTILIYTEQGLGDVILFARYLPLVVRVAARVIMAVHPPMRRLMQTIEGLTVVSIRDVPLPDFDVHCPLLSLPRVFATTRESIPQAVPYLFANRDEQALWAARIDADQTRADRLQVGIVWAGNPATRRDHFRSPGLASVAPLFSLPGIDFVVLQVGAGRDELAARSFASNILDLGSEVADLADTAAIMSGLDLMISSCTAPLHLAGAMGIPTWAMIPYAPYFPWLLERSDTPWYPSVKLYRQQQPGRDWSFVVDRMAADLTTLVRSRQNGSATILTEAARSVPFETPRQGEAGQCRQSNSPTTPRHSVPDQIPDGCNELALCRGGLMLYNRHDIYIGASLRKYGEFSAEETALFRIVVQPDRTVLDVGANIGAHTVDLSRLVGPGGVVHAFEPQRLVFQLLCANLALNSCTNVFAHQAAVGVAGKPMLVPFLDPGESHNHGGLSLTESGPGEAVRSMAIDSLELRDCQFIKLDVEGMEVEALHGAVATIRRCRPILYVENDRQARSAELIGLVRLYGYRLYWHLPPLYSADNFRAETENIFGGKVSVNMICIPAEIPQASLTNLREVTGPTDSVIRW